jgi:transcriptional regulator with XRE-family HTH domain
MAGTGTRRDELAQFLRSRRARLTPAEVGLAPGLRRRTPGLRREEVAQLAGVGVTWYTWLEQGRPINASVQILDAVARTLRLDRTEREHLYRLAEVPAVPDLADGEVLAPEVQAIMDSLAPLPACVYSGRYDVLAYNRMYGALCQAPRSGTRCNVLWSMFTQPACCSSIMNRDAELPQMVATFRTLFGRHVGEPAWVELVRRLSAASPEFARMWAAHDVAPPSTRMKIFRYTPGRPLRTISTGLAVQATPDARMVVYTPASDADLAILRAIDADPSIVGRCPIHSPEPDRAAAPVNQ